MEFDNLKGFSMRNHWLAYSRFPVSSIHVVWNQLLYNLNTRVGWWKGGLFGLLILCQEEEVQELERYQMTQHSLVIST